MAVGVAARPLSAGAGTGTSALARVTAISCYLPFGRHCQAAADGFLGREFLVVHQITPCL
jgi:hypothetical protein